MKAQGENLCVDLIQLWDPQLIKPYSVFVCHQMSSHLTKESPLPSCMWVGLIQSTKQSKAWGSRRIHSLPVFYLGYTLSAFVHRLRLE